MFLTQKPFRKSALALSIILVLFTHAFSTKTLIADQALRPNIILVMADDMGWGQTGYYNHPVLKTPHLDAMAEAGLRFDRFYAGAPVCSPTRASVLTGRSNRRTGVESHGYALRLQEKTIAQAMQKLGYATGHFGKWHLNGIRGPGVPILKEDTHNPGAFGFDMWLSVTNFFDRNPIMSRQGQFVEFEGDSSEIIVDEALTFIENKARSRQPSFTIIWYGTPHSPWMAGDEDKTPFTDLKPDSTEHYGELVAMDRSIGTLRQGLRDLKIAENTLVWFCSDNGGLPKIQPETVGGLRGFKGSVYEGGLRVPAIVEWPSVIKPRITEFPAVTMDIAPTLLEITNAPADSLHQPQDGMSLKELFSKELSKRKSPLFFSCLGKTAVIGDGMKIIKLESKKEKRAEYELYNLNADPHEQHNLISDPPKNLVLMRAVLDHYLKSISDSIAGKDYPEGKVNPGEPEPQQWNELDIYRPYFEAWKSRPEYRSRLKSINHSTSN